MPFQRRARITLTNESDKERLVYYQITYSLCDVPDDAARFCAQFRRVNPLRKGDVVRILDGVHGRGQYVGTYCAWGVNNSGWWGEGEVKFFIDGDDEFPTICGTGTEDYFCGSYNFDVGGQYTEFTTPYAGMPQVLRPDGAYRSQQRFGLYRWHLTDPIRFRTDLAVTMQALGWRRGGRYLQLQDDIATVAFWYQTLPLAPYPELPDRDTARSSDLARLYNARLRHAVAPVGAGVGAAADPCGERVDRYCGQDDDRDLGRAPEARVTPEQRCRARDHDRHRERRRDAGRRAAAGPSPASPAGTSTA